MTQLTLDKVTRKIQSGKDLPTLPSVATELLQMVRSPNISAAEIGTLISEDPTLTAKVLRVVNSAYYGFPRQIRNITHSIVILGFNKVRDVVMTASVIDSFKGRSTGFDFIAFWEHSIGVAIACDALARTLKSPVAEDAFVGGLLHDIGKAVLASYYGKDYQKALDHAQEHQTLLREAEQATLEFDHASVGRVLADEWKFPDMLVDTIRWHHAPATAKRGRDLACLVHIADIMARSVFVGSGGDTCIPSPDETPVKELKLTTKIMDQAMGDMFQGLARGRAFFDLLRSTRK